MAQKRKTQTKSSRSKAKTNSRKSSSKKKKIYIPVNSVITMCAIIVGISTALLLATYVSGSGKKIGSEKEHKIVETIKNQKPAENKVSVPEKTENQVLNKTSSQKKTQDKTASETKKTEIKQNQTSSTKTSSVSENRQNPVNDASNKIEKTVSSPVQEKPYSAGADSSIEKNTVSSTNSVSSSKPQSVITEKDFKAADIPDFPAANPGTKLVIIFDDGGHNMQQLEKCISLPFPVTVAVLPRLAHSKEAADRVRATGNEVMLHQPMQSVNLKVDPGAGFIGPSMGEQEIRSILFQNVLEVGPVAGINNHEGSLITADADKMFYVMKFCSDEGIWFLDSRTNADTKVPYVAGALGYSYYERNIFLDNKKTRENIIAEFVKGVNFANKNGVAIMIGHVWSADILPGVLRELYSVAVKKGYTFTTVSKSGGLIY